MTIMQGLKPPEYFLTIEVYRPSKNRLLQVGFNEKGSAAVREAG
jgi:hypothetical protein